MAIKIQTMSYVADVFELYQLIDNDFVRARFLEYVEDVAASQYENEYLFISVENLIEEFLDRVEYPSPSDDPDELVYLNEIIEFLVEVVMPAVNDNNIDGFYLYWGL